MPPPGPAVRIGGEALSPSGCALCAPSRHGAARLCAAVRGHTGAAAGATCAPGRGPPRRPPAGLRKAGASHRRRGAGPEPRCRPLPPCPGPPAGPAARSRTRAPALPAASPASIPARPSLSPRSTPGKTSCACARVPRGFPFPSPFPPPAPNKTSFAAMRLLTFPACACGRGAGASRGAAGAAVPWGCAETRRGFPGRGETEPHGHAHGHTHAHSLARRRRVLCQEPVRCPALPWGHPRSCILGTVHDASRALASSAEAGLEGTP